MLINFVFTDWHLVIMMCLFVAFGYHMYRNGRVQGFQDGVAMTFTVITKSGLATDDELDNAVNKVAKSENII
tara:strand:+ start:2468 stop:2683 length:216 start_codon:yes stop_codon:yes gene_type:complete